MEFNLHCIFKVTAAIRLRAESDVLVFCCMIYIINTDSRNIRLLSL